MADNKEEMWRCDMKMSTDGWRTMMYVAEEDRKTRNNTNEVLE